MGLLRKHGISLLIPTQNAARTVELCIRSFTSFPDEMIVVDNGSTDTTIEIVRRLEREIPHLTFYNAPDLRDLYENRQYALARSRYDWIVRIDSDYVAYTDGPRDIRRLRDLILGTRRTLRPITFGITQVNLNVTLQSTSPEDPENRSQYLPPPVTRLNARIIQWFPGLRFKRIGRWEGITLQKHLRKIQLPEPYWFHCNFKSKIDMLFRSERTNWRELGDFRTYPTLSSYVEWAIRTKYGTDRVDSAAEIYFEREIAPFLIPYDPDRYYPYPALLERDGSDLSS